jgi:iron complex transport system substrate-binding protein
MATAIVRAAGGTPWEEMAARDGAFKSVSFSEIAAWDPRLIALSLPAGTEPSNALAALRAAPRAEALKAVQAGRLFALPADLSAWDDADPRWILGLDWLAARIHPGRFGDFVQDAALYDFFAGLYGLDKSAVDALIRPAIRQPAK